MVLNNKVNILGCQIDNVTMPKAIEKVAAFMDGKHTAHVITLNAEIAYTARNDDKLRDVINHADLVTPDGIGIVWAGRKLGHNIKERVTGIDMIYQICQRAEAKRWKLFLLGAAPGVAELAAQELAGLYPGLMIVGTRDGYFSEQDIPVIIREINQAAPQVLLVALGAPKQEFWINNYKQILKVPVCVGVGGSFDVLAGNKKRAPKIIIKLNLEWLYRLLAEPSRLKRQMVLPRFVLAVLRQKRSKLNAD